MSDFTPAQKQAIDITSGNVLVSAGAGSGKTKVLTERVRRLVVEQRVPLDSLVVLTFTNAAAHEMKERIRKALLANPSTAHLAAEVDASDITTFDAYALSLVKKFHEFLGIPKTVNNLDQTILYIEKKRIMNDIFMENYQNKIPSFLNLIRNHVLRDDTKIQDYILSIDAKADLKLDKEAYLNHYMSHYFSEEFIAHAIDELTSLLYEKIECMRQLSYRIQNEKELDHVNYLLASLTPNLDYDALRLQLLDSKMKAKVRNLEDEDGAVHDAIKRYLVEAKTICDLGSKEEIRKQYFENVDTAKLILDMINKLNLATNEFKRMHQSYAFADIAKMALKLLDHPIVQEKLKQKIRYIMIDEYQDTSDLQEAFLQKIANQNLYMVGDIKQSIYRFRNANSGIFADKFEKYGKGIGGIRVDLNHNFRSREEVLMDINHMFSQIMTRSFGGADYALEHQILFGNESYKTSLQTQDNHHMSIYTYDEDDERKDYEIEAEMIAQDILRKTDQGYLVVDRETSKIRKARYEDFTLLLDRKTKFEEYRTIFEKYGIPLDVEKDEAILSTDVALTLLSLVRLLYGVNQHEEEKVILNYFMSVARSFLFRLSDQEIWDLMKSGNYKQHYIMQKIAQVNEQYNYLSLSMLLTTLLETFDFYYQIIRIGNVQSNLCKIENVIKLSQTLENLQFTLADFVNFFNDIKNQKMDIQMKDNDAPLDAVKIMSIHGSKGLEFPIVYYAGLSTKFNQKDQVEKFFMHSDYGFHLPSTRKDGMTIFHHLMKAKENKDDISEKIRLFYVALTRAREKVILIRKKRKEKLLSSIAEIKCLDDLLVFCNGLSMYDETFEPYTVKQDIRYREITEDRTLSIEKLTISSMQKKKLTKASKTVELDVDPQLLLLGTQLHYLLEIVDYYHKDTSFIQDTHLKALVDRVIHLPLFDCLNEGELYREFRFVDETTNTSGIIDGFILCPHVIILFDYKLANIDDEAYDEQLQKYAAYLRKQYQRPVEAYLISMVKGSFRQVEIFEE